MTATGPQLPLQALARRVRAAAQDLPFARPVGDVRALGPSAVDVGGLSRSLQLASLVEIGTARGAVLAEVIRLDHDVAQCKPYDQRAPVALSDPVHPRGELLYYPHRSWRGRIIDALARPADGGEALVRGERAVRLASAPPAAMSRQIVSKGFSTGVRVLDAFTPLCLGQRLGVFAGSGVGKSTLLSMIARASAFDSVIVSLVGERGREVREFVEHTLGAAAQTAVTILATGDESAMMRRLAPQLATALAEHFRDLGQNVLLIMDSVTRYAHACREVALAAGEPPVARGYPPSVFSDLPQLLERAGPGVEGQGTITGIYAVLVDGDDHNDPVADTVRGTLDGHIVLDRAIAEQGRYPAVNLLSSLSRLAQRVWTADQARVVQELKRLAARFEDTRDLRAMGGHVPGADAELDRAVELVPKLYRVLSQLAADPPSADPFRDIAVALSGGL
ncbi:MAG: flagellar protein export ATPase FliI [Aestuariivirga sp.]|uniref:FliI/YscN family ATPase n=1 Tax=Aestuariivirga sp. TaxID=2650926 RepID=UPI0025BE9B02|nr:FliI/YscN family ATPase [Aestuariivirga sp.]MCA3561425.1 flagellar protein export ATPase FliI [Aestuariivirga sp.]